MRILLIEDNEASNRLFCHYLERAGYRDVVTAFTGFDGLQAAQDGERPVDLCFIDFNLPDIHGLQIGLSLANQMRRSNIPKVWLVALTAHTKHEVRMEAQRYGFDAFLGKPVEDYQMIAVLQHFERLRS